MSMKNYVHADICKGIAILTVIWHHSIIIYPVNLLENQLCLRAWTFDHTYFMQIFFLVSGFLFAKSTSKPFKQFLYGKIERLLLPYICYEGVNLIVKLVAPVLVNRKIVSIGHYLYALLFTGGELWFLYVLFIVFIIWASILRKTSKFTLIFILIALVLMSAYIPGNLLGGIFLYKSVIKFSFFFIAGYLLGVTKQSFFSKSISLIISSTCFATLCFFFLNNIMHNVYIWFVLSISGCFFVLSLSFQIKKIKELRNILVWFGRNSLPLYWLNGFALVLSREAILHVSNLSRPILIVVSIFFMCLLFEVASISVIKRIPVISKLIGFR